MFPRGSNGYPNTVELQVPAPPFWYPHASVVSLASNELPQGGASEERKWVLRWADVDHRTKREEMKHEIEETRG